MKKIENYFEITEDLYCEAIRRMIPIQRYFIYGLATVLLVVSALVMFIGKNYQTGVMWAILALLLGFYGFAGITLKAKKFYRANFSSICDANGVFWKRTEFLDESFTVTEPKSRATFKYKAVRAVNESKNLYIIIMEEKQLLFLKKGAFIESSDSEFIEFLKNKCGAKN